MGLLLAHPSYVGPYKYKSIEQLFPIRTQIIVSMQPVWKCIFKEIPNKTGRGRRGVRKKHRGHASVCSRKVRQKQLHCVPKTSTYLFFE